MSKASSVRNLDAVGPKPRRKPRTLYPDDLAGQIGVRADELAQVEEQARLGRSLLFATSEGVVHNVTGANDLASLQKTVR